MSLKGCDSLVHLTLHMPGHYSPETILTTGASSWSSKGMELVFMGSSKPITPLLSCRERETQG